MSVASRLLRYAPSIRRAHTQYATAGSTRATMDRLMAQPSAYDPPRRTPRDVTVTPRRNAHEWPVYEVTGRGRRGSPGPEVVVLFLHGGAYFREIKAQHWRFAAHLASSVGARVLVPIYPLAPSATAETVVPAVVQMVVQVVTDLAAATDGAAGSTPARIALVGDSAGAGMALAVTQELILRGHRAPDALVLLSPWVDVSCSDPGLAPIADRDPWLQVPGLRAAGDAYRGALAADHPWVSPVHGPLAGLPDLLVLTGTDDILNADAHRLVDAVRAAATSDGRKGAVELVEAIGQIHDYALHPSPEGRAARRLVTGWLEARVSG